MILSKKLAIQHILILCIALAQGCQQKQGCPNPLPVIQHQLSAKFGSGGNEGYYHYLYLEGYENHCFNSTPFNNLAYGYLDTISFDTPVLGLNFYSSREVFEEDHRGEKRWKDMDRHLVIGFGFEEKSVSSLKPRVEIVEFFKGNELHVVDLRDMSVYKK